MENLTHVSLGLIVLTFLASFAACFFSTLSGGGAGLILLPILLFTGLPYINALASHKLAVGFIGVGSTIRFVKEKLVNWRVVAWSAVVGIPFVIIGTRFAAIVPGETMKPIVGGTILVMVVISLFKNSAAKVFHPKSLTWKIAFIGAIILAPIAFYSGWISAGSGIFTTFLYLFLLKYDQLKATAITAAANGLFWNGVGAIAHIFMGHVIWPLAPGLVFGAILGSYAGASLGIRKGNKFLRIIFLGTAVVTGVLLFFQ